MDAHRGDVDLDLAVIGGGVAGTSVAHAMAQVRPDWVIGLFERTDRIGGRLYSIAVDGLDHKIELGGMRLITSQPRVTALVETLGLATHAFDATGGRDRSFLRGQVGGGADDNDAGRGYELAAAQRGRSAGELAMAGFEEIVPGFRGLDHEGHVRWRATGRLRDRPVTDWSIGEALETLLGSGPYRFVKDAFGYDSGMRSFCAPDFVEFLFDGGDPAAEARTPDDGMDRIPRELEARFAAAGGRVWLGHELDVLTVEDGIASLRFANLAQVTARRVVLAMPVPALRILAERSPSLAVPVFGRVLDSVEGFPAMKLYLWYDRPWWRPAVTGIRTTTDLPVRKIFYFDGEPGSRSVLLGMYTDGRDVEPWAELHDRAPAGAPAPAAMLAELQRQLREAHPEVATIPPPVGSALMFWGADPFEVGWHFWRAGERSDEILDLAPQPDPTLPVYLANEAFSRRQSWVEGALEAAEAAVERLMASSSDDAFPTPEP
jgi:monoamine oxidase